MGRMDDEMRHHPRGTVVSDDEQRGDEREA
jgi:hypothetical protein